MSKRIYTSSMLDAMNSGKLWNGTIVYNNRDYNKVNKVNNDIYELHACGDCSLDGRTYVAIKKETIITKELKQKLNLM